MDEYAAERSSRVGGRHPSCCLWGHLAVSCTSTGGPPDAATAPRGVHVRAALTATLGVIRPFRRERLAGVARVVGVPSEGRSTRETAEAGVGAVRQLLSDIGFPTLSEATGAGAEEIEDVLVAMTAGKLSNWPKRDQVRIREIARRSLCS